MDHDSRQTLDGLHSVHLFETCVLFYVYKVDMYVYLQMIFMIFSEKVKERDYKKTYNFAYFIRSTYFKNKIFKDNKRYR